MKYWLDIFIKFVEICLDLEFNNIEVLLELVVVY